MGFPPGTNTAMYPFNTPSTFGEMPDGHFFEATGHRGAFVKRGLNAQPSVIWHGIQDCPGSKPVVMDPATPVRYFNGTR